MYDITNGDKFVCEYLDKPVADVIAAAVNRLRAKIAEEKGHG
jgi:hypothetical protein